MSIKCKETNNVSDWLKKKKKSLAENTHCVSSLQTVPQTKTEVKAKVFRTHLPGASFKVLAFSRPGSVVADPVMSMCEPQSQWRTLLWRTKPEPLTRSQPRAPLWPGTCNAAAAAGAHFLRQRPRSSTEHEQHPREYWEKPERMAEGKDCKQFVMLSFLFYKLLSHL